MTTGATPLDPRLLTSAAGLVGESIDPEYTLCLPDTDEAPLAGTLAALANGKGGHILLGARADAAGRGVVEVRGVERDVAEQRLHTVAAQLDPSVADLIQIRKVDAEASRALLVVTVRQSPTPPHLDPISSRIYVMGSKGVETIRTRGALDSLYTKGKAERERADRLIEATIERLMLAQYAFYGLGIVACLQQPSADPYLWAREYPNQLADPSDRFIEEWRFAPELVKVRPGEAELRNEREVCGLVRVTRAGCIAMGETRRKPPGDMLGTPVELTERIELMVETACRVLSHAPAARIVPRLFCEGLRGMKLVVSRQPYRESAATVLDMLQAPGTVGDPTDVVYRRELIQFFAVQLCALFQVDLRLDGEVTTNQEGS